MRRLRLPARGGAARPGGRARRGEAEAGRGLARSAGDRGALAPSAILLEDVADAVERLAPAPLEEALPLVQAIGRHLRLRLVGDRHARGFAGPLLELPDRERPDAIELPVAADEDDAARGVGLEDGLVDVREAVEAPREGEARPGAPAVGVLARQAPPLGEVVHELGVVGDVGEVVVDLALRARDEDG